MANLPEVYDSFALEEEIRDLQQKIDDLKTQIYFTPQTAAPISVEVGTLAYSDGTNTSNTFGSSTEGFYYYASGSTWTPIGTGGSGNTVIVQDEGTPLSTSASTLNFVGSGVAATGTGATKTITITSGGSSTNISPEDESSDTTCFPVFVTDAASETRPKTDASALNYNASTGDLASTKLTASGALSGGSLDINGNADISGDLTGLDNITSSVVKVTGQSAAPGSASAGTVTTINSNYTMTQLLLI